MQEYPTAQHICPHIAIDAASVLPSSKLPNNDLLLYITTRPNPEGVVGATTVCRRDYFGRPAVVHINLHAPLVMRLHMLATRHAALGAQNILANGSATIVRLLQHEMMHALALTWTTISQFRVASRHIRSQTVSERTRNEEVQRLLVTPHTLYAIRQHFDVPNSPDQLQLMSAVPGLELVGHSADPPEPGQVCTPLP
jgi:hypothetical protein